MGHKILIVVESDSNRRAELVSMFGIADWYVEPYESTKELAAHWPRAGTFLVRDEEDQVLETLELVKLSGSWRPLLAYSGSPRASRVVDCVRSGVLDYWDTNDFQSAIELRLDQILKGSEHYIERHIRWMEAKSRLDRLTYREQQILEKVSLGATTKEIARDLAISTRTVESHRSHIRGKLENGKTADVVRLLLETQLINLGDLMT